MAKNSSVGRKREAKKAGVWDSKKGQGVGRDECVTNYLFTEFSETSGAKEIFEVFK